MIRLKHFYKYFRLKPLLFSSICAGELCWAPILRARLLPPPRRAAARSRDLAPITGALPVNRQSPARRELFFFSHIAFSHERTRLEESLCIIQRGPHLSCDGAILVKKRAPAFLMTLQCALARESIDFLTYECRTYELNEKISFAREKNAEEKCLLRQAARDQTTTIEDIPVKYSSNKMCIS